MSTAPGLFMTEQLHALPSGMMSLDDSDVVLLMKSS